MIEKLKINNFQSHSETEISFSPNVTVITGKSQSGKTAVLRAFRWLVENRPKGFRFHSYFTDEPTEITLSVEGRKITHFKSEKDEFYSLEDKVFRAFSFGVPDEILNVLNLGTINVQDQFEEPFLITSSPGNFARVINEITNLDKVDDWVSALTTRINSTNKEISLCENDIQVFQEKISKYDGLEEVEEVLKLYESIEKKISDQEEAIDYFKNILQDLRFNENVIDSLSWVEEAQEILKQIELIDSEVEEIRQLFKEWNYFVELNEWIGGFEKVIPLWKELEEIQQFINRFTDINTLFEDLETVGKEIQITEKEVSKRKKEYKDLLSKYKLCPFCFSEVTSSQLKRIEELI